MCDGERLRPTRRQFLSRASALALAPVLSGVTATPARSRSASADLATPALTDVGMQIHPRSDWAAQGPVGALYAEHDVRFLLVHHTAGTNSYEPGDVPAILRDIYALHTGARGWADVAYNFFVDRYGGAWEGRAGSLAGAIEPDATGGSQGYSQLVSFIGDHTSQEPTPEAMNTAVAVLAMLADRHGINTSPGATVSFVSRGSNRWSAGTTVNAATISGHRDMSLTACPGDAAYRLLADGTFARRVTSLRQRPVPPRLKQARWFLASDLASGRADPTFGFGDPGDVPLVGDWNGDGATSPGVVRGITWYLRDSNTTGAHDVTFLFGNPGDWPVVGRWVPGDSRHYPGVFRDGTWYLKTSQGGGSADIVVHYGDPGDVPVVGRWHAGMTTDGLGVVRGNRWFLRFSLTDGMADSVFSYGNPVGDRPVVGDWNNDGIDTPGVFRSGIWYLRNSNATGIADVVAGFGDGDDNPITGRWQPGAASTVGVAR